MWNKEIAFGGLKTRGSVFLAPLAGYTNYPFRLLAKEAGAGLCFTEMVSAKGLKYGNENTKELLYTNAEEGLCAAQLFGNDPDILRAACESEALAPFPAVDLNMGCPVPKIYKNGEGSALLETPKLAEQIVKACVKSGKVITVKFRIGIDGEHLIAAEFAKRMEGAGASLLTVHGRTKDKIYAGEVNYREIAAAKKSVKIPVVANGGVFSVADGEKLMRETGADGIMIARAALFDPQIFCEFSGVARKGKYESFVWQTARTRELFDEKFTTVFMRKMGAFYIKGAHGAAAFKERFFAAATPEEVLAVAKEAFEVKE